jgi:hypothetical protein
MMDTVGSFFFSFGSPEPVLTFGRLCRHQHPDNTNRKVLSAAKGANESSLSLGASQQLEVRQLFDLLKTCLRWEARLLEAFFLPLFPVTKFGVLDGSVRVFGES